MPRRTSSKAPVYFKTAADRERAQAKDQVQRQAEQKATLNKALATFFVNSYDMIRRGGKATGALETAKREYGEAQIEVLATNGPPDTPWATMFSTACELTAADLATVKSLAPNKFHRQVPIARLWKSPKGRRDVLVPIYNILQPLFSAGYVAVNCFLVISMGRDNAAKMFHQDKQTGSNAFNRNKLKGVFHRETRVALRVLIDLGSYDNQTRTMQFAIQRDDGTRDIVLTLDARIIAMDALAAGSGRESNVEHARVGNGITFSCDVVAPSTQTTKGDIFAAGEMASLESTETSAAFMRKPPSEWPKDTLWSVAAALVADDEAERAAAAARAELNVATCDIAEHHCHRCADDAVAFVEGVFARAPGERKHWFALCAPCKKTAERLQRRKGFTTATFHAAFVQYTECPLGCTCTTKVPPKKRGAESSTSPEKKRDCRAAADEDE
jgi:hypothetical protein